MNVIHSVEDNNSQIIHVSVNSNDRGATGEKGDSVTNLRITEENRLEATLSNGQTIDGGAVPAIKTRRVFVADMDGVKRTYILPLNIESSQVSYILMNGVAYSDGYILQSGEITLNYDDLPAGRLEVVLNDNSGHVSGINVSINGKTGDIHLKTINGANLDGDGDIEVATLDVFNNEVRAREEADNNLRNSLSDHEARISNNESTISSHNNNLSSLNANISSINNQMMTLTNDVHEVTDNYVPKTRRINDKFLSHDMRLTADDVEALPITAGVTHPVRGELVVNGHIIAENATQDNHVVTKAQLDAKVAEVVNSAPETLDTLEELSKALGDDPNFATTVANRIGTVDKKIDTEINKLTNKVEANTEDLKTTKQKANTNSTNISLLNSTVATNKLSSDTQFSNVAKEQDDQDTLISDILNAFSAESDKGTNLKLNSSATKVLGVSIYGNTEQAKYTGKNLLKLSTNPTISNGLSSTVSDDGLVKYSGRTTDSWGDITTLLYFPAPLTAGKYTFSIDHPRTHRIIFKYKLADNTFSEIIANMTATSTSNTFTTTQPIVAGYLYIAAANSSSLNDTVKAQLEIGDTATDYEPYTGGYNNLFDESSELPKTTDGITVTNQNGILKLTGLPTRNWVNVQQQVITPLLVNGGTYTLVNYNVTDKGYLELSRQRKNGSWEHINTLNKRILTFTVDFNTYSLYKVQINMGPVASYNNQPITMYNNYALFQGDYTEDNLPEYSPYNTGLASPRPQLPQVVKELSGGNIKVVNKNLAVLENKPYTNTDLAVQVNEDSSITVQGENKNFWGMNITTNKFIDCPLKKGDIVTLSIDKPLPYTIKWYAMRDDNIAIDNFCNILAGETSKTATIPANLLYGRLFFNISQIGLQVPPITFKVQLEYGDTATPFVSHESARFTLPSGLNIYKLTDTIYDEIKLESGVAKLIKRVGKIELSGEEANLSLYKNTVSGMIGFSYGAGNPIFKQSKLVPDIICSHFNSINESDTWHGLLNSSGVSIFAGRDNFPLSVNKIVFWFSITDMQNLKTTDLTGFKNWLKSEKAKGTPVTVYYEMRDYIEEEITDQATLTELKRLMEMRTYKDVTDISVIGDSLVPEIKVKYMRKIGG